MAKEVFSRYDTADYLKSEEDVAAYLEAVMEEGGDDPAYVARARGVVARARNMSSAPATWDCPVKGRQLVGTDRHKIRDSCGDYGGKSPRSQVFAANYAAKNIFNLRKQNNAEVSRECERSGPLT